MPPGDNGADVVVVTADGGSTISMSVRKPSSNVDVDGGGATFVGGGGGAFGGGGGGIVYQRISIASTEITKRRTKQIFHTTHQSVSQNWRQKQFIASNGVVAFGFAQPHIRQTTKF